MTSKTHWESVYQTKKNTEVSWYTEHLSESVKLIETHCRERSSLIADIGGGASTLVDDLLGLGYSNIHVLDIAETALATSKARLGDHAQKVTWHCSAVAEAPFAPNSVQLWHDRAVLHFMTEEPDLIAYIKKLRESLISGGIAILSPFASNGPTACSGLPVRRYDIATLMSVVGHGFQLLDEKYPVHITPAGREQHFLLAVLKKE